MLRDVLDEWVEQGKISQREASRLLEQFLKGARRGQRNVQKMVQTGTRQALLTGTGALRHQVDELHKGLGKLSRKLAEMERDYAPSPARARSGSASRRSRSRKPPVTRKAA